MLDLEPSICGRTNIDSRILGKTRVYYSSCVSDIGAFLFMLCLVCIALSCLVCIVVSCLVCIVVNCLVCIVVVVLCALL